MNTMSVIKMHSARIWIIYLSENKKDDRIMIEPQTKEVALDGLIFFLIAISLNSLRPIIEMIHISIDNGSVPQHIRNIETTARMIPVIILFKSI